MGAVDAPSAPPRCPQDKRRPGRRWVADALSAAGFEVQHGCYDLPAAVRATVGTGQLHIGICAEYDALPDIGHACGHNIIAAAAVGAGAALAGLADDLGLTVTVLGSPAEEGGGGKILTLERAAFEGLDEKAAPEHGCAAAKRRKKRAERRLYATKPRKLGPGALWSG
jgi:metal-dependent amidase/aminoacylase/carboxypeptidase family protein